MGEANMDSSSESDDTWNPEDKKSHAEAIARADSHVQIRSTMTKGKESKKR